MFNDHAFRDRLSLSGVNSINWARIVAQVTYYFVAGAALGAPLRPITVSVPTGNFGDILAGWVAKRMGLPIERLVIASNENDILPRAHATGVYEMRGVVETTSPSMDIQISSNFERYLFEASGRDAGFIRGAMGSLSQGGRFDLAGTAAQFKSDFAASSASEAEVADAIRRTRVASGYLLDPHTACGLVALEKTVPQSAVPGIVLSTAHPAKFPDAMERITGERPGLPPRLSNLLTDAEGYPVLENDVEAVKRFVEGTVQPASAGAS
jgi:threonine synthase